jgi:hypothetical protein
MAQEYPPRRFFRNAPNLMLQRYFAARNVLSKVDFSARSETQVARLWTAHGDPLRRRHIRLSERYQLAYTSSREDAGGRATMRADRLRAQLGWEPGILN